MYIAYHLCSPFLAEKPIADGMKTISQSYNNKPTACQKIVMLCHDTC